MKWRGIMLPWKQIKTYCTTRRMSSLSTPLPVKVEVSFSSGQVSQKWTPLLNILFHVSTSYHESAQTANTAWLHVAIVVWIWIAFFDERNWWTAGTVVRGIHLELLVDHHPPAHGLHNSFWKVNDMFLFPMSILERVGASVADVRIIMFPVIETRSDIVASICETA